MSERKITKPVALAVGTALAGSFAVTGIANADTAASPFAMTTLSVGYMLGTGEGNCGGDNEDEAQEKDAEGSCGGDKGAEGSCGGDKEGGAGEKDAEEKGAEGKCGEGKCGGST